MGFTTFSFSSLFILFHDIVTAGTASIFLGNLFNDLIYSYNKYNTRFLWGTLLGGKYLHWNKQLNNF